MNKFYITLFAACVSMASMASTQWTLQGNTYTVDTVAHAKVGPGTTQTSVHAVGAYNLNIFYSVTDLSDPNVEMRAVMANDKIASVATVTNMAKAHNAEGALHFAGVNADFFGNSAPIGTTVVDGEVYFSSNNGWTHWALDENNKPHLGQMTIGGVVSNAAGTASHELTGFNHGRGENQLIIFNPRFGANTGTNAYGSEVLLTPVDGAVALGKSVKMKVTGTPQTAGSMAIPAGCYVLSGHGTAKTFVAGLTDGEEITVNATLTLGETSITARQVLGGQPMILSGGVVLDTESALDHLTALNPRTAVGHDATGTKLVMLVVDGRGVSQGCVSKVLADIMREVGCTEAMNFDGGGSSTFYVDAFGVVNYPSGGGAERAVTNGLYAVATSPTDNEIASIAFADYKMTLPRYGYYTPVIYGYNKYGVLVDANVQGFTLSCVPELGEVTNDGASLFANGSGYHGLTATYGSATASIPVEIGDGAPSFKLSTVLVDSFTDYVVDVAADVNGVSMPLDNQALTWSSADESIATVDASGCVHGVKDGATCIYGSVEGISDTLLVNVEIPESRYKAFEQAVDASTWTLAKSGMKSDAAVSALGAEGLAFDYTVSSARGPYIGAAKTIRLWSRPDSIQLMINPGDATVKSMSLQVVRGYDGRAAWVNDIAVQLTPSVVNNVLLSVRDLLEVTDMAAYPLTIEAIRFYVSDATGVAHRIEIPHMNAVYTNIAPEVGGVESVLADTPHGMWMISPNCVRAGEQVSLGEEVDYAVYSINGVLVAGGCGNLIDTVGLPQGLYIVRGETAFGVKTARLIIR